MAQSRKGCLRDSDLSDSGSVSMSRGPGLEVPAEPAEAPGKFGLLGAVDQSRGPSEVPSKLCFPGVQWLPLSSHQKAMSWKAAAAQDCTEAAVVSGMVLPCVGMTLRRAELCSPVYPIYPVDMPEAQVPCLRKPTAG